MEKDKETLVEAWNKFISLPDLRVRLKIAGLQIALDEQDKELTQRENLIVNQEIEHRRQIQLVQSALPAISRNTATANGASILMRADTEVGVIAPIQQSLTLFIDPYIRSINDNRERADWVNEQGLDDHRRTCKILIEIIGDKPITEITIEDRNRFDDVIKRYPVNREKVRETRGKTLDEILALPSYQRINLKTAKFHASRANAFLQWVARQTGSPSPLTLLENVRIKKGKGVEKKRREFKDNELRMLFAASTYPLYGPTDKLSPYKYWIPLIALFTGARLNEIAQLRTADIIEIDGTICFHITEESTSPVEGSQKYLAKSVKTHAATRIVPVHSKLIELGFIDYLAEAKKLGCVLLFEDLAHAKTKYGALVSKWFAAHCDKIGLSDKALTFHSFRHGTIGHLRRNRIPKDIRMVVVGHSAAEDTHDEYGDIHGDITLQHKKDAIESINFNHVLDFAALKNNAPTASEIFECISRKKLVHS